MKKLFAAIVLLPVIAFAQVPQNIQKLSGNLTQDFNVGDGRSITVSGTGGIWATSIPASGVSGTLAVANGGTGANTFSANAIILGNLTSALQASNLTYSGSALSVPDAFAVSSAGSIDLTAGGTNENITITPSGTGNLVASFNGTTNIQNGNNVALLVGADAALQSVTNSVNKVGRIGTPHFTTSQNPLALIFGSSTTSTGVVSIGGGTSSMTAATAIDFYTAANSTTTIGTRRGGFNSAGAFDLTGAFSTTDATDSSGATTTSSIKTAGGASIAKSLYVGGMLDQTATVTLPAGTRNAINFGYTGVGDSGGTSVLIAINTVPTVSGAQNVSQIRGMYINPRNGLDSGKTLADEYGNFIDVFNVGAGATTNGYGQYTRPRTSSTGGFSTFTYSKYDTGVYSSSGDITNAIVGTDVADIGRAAATTVTAFNVANQTKGSGNAYAYRGQMASASGKYNLYMDGTAQNYLEGALIGGTQALSGAGAINVTQTHTDFTSTGGAQALTLANGTTGQLKTIVHVVDGGSGVLTPTTKVGFSTITFTNAGDSVTLRYSASGWAVVGSYGVTIAP